MTRLFRSISFNLVSSRNTKKKMFISRPPIYDSTDEEYDDDVGEGDDWRLANFYNEAPISTPLNRNFDRGHQFSVVAVLATALRKSIVTCGVDVDDVSSSSMDISGPTEVRHVSHVTFDRFNGFLGLPVEFEPEIPSRVPSASANVFGVSAKSMQCSYDERGNSVPTILLTMQNRLYSEGGLQAEGIFRINAENTQERHVRNQLNRGVVPCEIDIHCLAGLIKAWFRELPTGVLDFLTPEQVMQCNTEDDCIRLVNFLPQTEAALLDWAINLMADVVEHEHTNKMNARNIAMVFAPNMTKMDDPLTALLHAVQVMNFLKTLITITLQERQESTTKANLLSTSSNFAKKNAMENRESETEEIFWSFKKKTDDDEEEEEEYESVYDENTPESIKKCEKIGYDGNKEGEGMLERLNLQKRVRKLCNHPVFNLSKSVKKRGNIGIVNNRSRDGEACV